MKKKSKIVDTNNLESYIDAIRLIKNAILQSRYTAATLANRELLSLYFYVGEYVALNTRNRNWGTGAIEIISARLQQELPGLRGFSPTNIKNMRLFYEAWKGYLQNRQLPTDDLKGKKSGIAIRQLATDKLPGAQKESFMRVGFTHHTEIISKVKNPEERLFYIERCAAEFWSVEKLRYNLKGNLFGKKGTLQSNFSKTITDSKFRFGAFNSFKDELLLDFVNITDPDEEPDERVLEQAIVNDIKKFIMALGTDFSFMGNQYRLLVHDEEFFIDLLFFNRKLRSLVAIELKKGKFKAEYVGKMNFYLSALDEYVKQPHENPSIGIILCKEKNNKIVEFAFRDTSKPMGVATYKTATELPAEYKNILPDADKLKKLL
ncbi:DUF1016 family protein [bacterium]|nr:DUF1016 family protein [bacterium]